MWPLGIVVVGLVLTLAAALMAQQSAQREQQILFDAAVAREAANFEAVLDAHLEDFTDAVDFVEALLQRRVAVLGEQAEAGDEVPQLVAGGGVKMYPRTEMLDLVVVDGHAKGIVVRDMVSGEISSHAADCVILATGGYGNVFFLSTNAKGCNVMSAFRAYKHGAYFSNPCYTQIHPTCIPVSGDYQSKLTLMSESLRNDGRVWVPKKANDTRHPNEIPEDERDYYLERRYPAFGNLVPRDVASRAAKLECDSGQGVGSTGMAVFLDFRDAIQRSGKDVIKAKYGNLFQMYETITGEDPYQVPMRIYPAVHYTMGGLWVDYNLMSSIPGLFVIGEANFSDHGANRLGASALMQGLADGYFVIADTVSDYIGKTKPQPVDTDAAAFSATEKEV